MSAIRADRLAALLAAEAVIAETSETDTETVETAAAEAAVTVKIKENRTEEADSAIKAELMSDSIVKTK